MFAPSDFLNLDQTEHRTIFDNSTQVWDVLKQIGSYLQFRLKPAVYARVLGRPFISENVYIGDRVEIGCNAVISPGSIIGRNSLIYPLTHFGGVLAENSILKLRQDWHRIDRQ